MTRRTAGGLIWTRPQYVLCFNSSVVTRERSASSKNRPLAYLIVPRISPPGKSPGPVLGGSMKSLV